jgi:PiT family inorganic phosphate transporter
LGIHFFSMVGIPVSTSQSIVGGVLGVGLVHGVRTVPKRKLLEIGSGWVLTPVLAGIVSFLLYAMILRLGG